jgi:tetratricopeptide (TPR) repeat protein
VTCAFAASLLWSTPARHAEAVPQEATRPRPIAPTATSVSFEKVAASAARARENDAPDEAIRWYRRGVRMRPAWDEGWWYLATLLYDHDRYAEARDAFAGFLRRRPGAGPAWALRGLCEFQIQEYAASARHLSRWVADGSPGNTETSRVAWYHLSVLRIRDGQFELALDPMTQLCRSGSESPEIVRAAGLMLLRMATFPAEVAGDKAEMVDLAGRAVYSWLAVKVDEAQARFQDLIRRFPEAPNAHYCYGLFLMVQDPEAALAQFRAEMEVQPGSVYPRLETAFELLKRGDFAGARPYAAEAVKLAPDLFAAHNALGRVLVESDDLPRGIEELEKAARLAPDSPEMFYSLGQAYSRAGRPEDAEKARATFRRLEEARRAKKAAGRALGADPPPTSTPQ